MTAARTYTVHPAHDAHHPHHVQGASFEDAALAFIERWHPAPDSDGEVSVVVLDPDGARQCFRIDLDTGETGPCD